jgi:hypothetical protein
MKYEIVTVPGGRTISEFSNSRIPIANARPMPRCSVFTAIFGWR